MKNGIRDIETLEKVVKLTDLERDQIQQCLGKFTMEITPYYAALMDRDDPECPVRMQSVPRIAEMHDDPSDMADPLHEDVDSPVPGLTHRYPDRVLLLVTNICSHELPALHAAAARRRRGRRHAGGQRLRGDRVHPQDAVGPRRPPQRRRPARPPGRQAPVDPPAPPRDPARRDHPDRDADADRPAAADHRRAREHAQAVPPASG